MIDIPSSARMGLRCGAIKNRIDCHHHSSLKPSVVSLTSNSFVYWLFTVAIVGFHRFAHIHPSDHSAKPAIRCRTSLCRSSIHTHRPVRMTPPSNHHLDHRHPHLDHHRRRMAM